MSARAVLGTVTVGAAGILLAGCSLLGAAAPTPTPSSTDGATSTDVFEIAVGDCLLAANTEGDVNSVEKVDCTEPHAREAYASIQMEDGDFPGDEAAKATAISECTTAFNSFVGVDYGLSTLNFAMIFPTQGSWENDDDREILCLITDPAGDVTGSLKGAAR